MKTRFAAFLTLATIVFVAVGVYLGQPGGPINSAMGSWRKIYGGEFDALKARVKALEAKQAAPISSGH